MASRFHWVRGSIDQAWPHNLTAGTPVTLPIPAGGILKKFLCHHCLAHGVQGGNGFTAVGVWALTMTVTIASGTNIGREIFDTRRAIPGQHVAFFDVTTPQRIYNAYYSAGDKELGFNQQCSYGKITDPAWSIKLDWFPLNEVGGLNGIVDGRIILGFDCLYFL
jgi:hypothetical protein